MAGINYKIGTISSKFHYPYEGIFGTGSGPSYIIKEATGNGYINLTNAVRNRLIELKAYGGTINSDVPIGYTQLDYITLDLDSYFDTGLVINSFDVTVKSKHSITTEDTSPSMMWGYMGGNSNLPRRGVGRYHTYFLWGANFTSVSGTGSFDTNVHEFTGRVYTNSEEQIRREMSMDGGDPSSSSLPSPETWSSNTLSIYIGARNNIGGVGNFTSGDFYNLNLIQNGVCIGNIVPVIRDSDMTVGLYNTITNTFLTNLGTGIVTAGPNTVPTPTAPMNIVCNNGVVKVSPNLANYISSNVTLGYWLQNSDGAPTSSSSNFYTAMFRIKPDTSYVFYGRSKTDNSLSRRNRVAWYDENGTWIRNFTEYADRTISIDTSPSNAAYARFHCNPVGSTDVTQEIVDDYNWIFQEGTAEVTYMPYGQIYVDGTVETIEDELGNTATAEMLLKVGDYVDEQEILSGNITRKVGIIVLDGTETVDKTTSSNAPLGYYFSVTNTNWQPHIYASSETFQTIYSSHFLGVTSGVGNLANNTVQMRAGNNYLKHFNFATSAYTTETELSNFFATQYAAGTPVIIVYSLAEETTETATGQIMNISAGSSTIEITQASIDNLGLYAKYKATA